MSLCPSLSVLLPVGTHSYQAGCYLGSAYHLLFCLPSSASLLKALPSVTASPCPHSFFHTCSGLFLCCCWLSCLLLPAVFCRCPSASRSPASSALPPGICPSGSLKAFTVMCARIEPRLNLAGCAGLSRSVSFAGTRLPAPGLHRLSSAGYYGVLFDALYRAPSGGKAYRLHERFGYKLLLRLPNSFRDSTHVLRSFCAACEPLALMPSPVQYLA